MSNLFFSNFSDGTGGSLSADTVNWWTIPGGPYPLSKYAGEVRAQDGSFQYASVGCYNKLVPASPDYSLSVDFIIRSFLNECYPILLARAVDENNYYSLVFSETTRVVTLGGKLSGTSFTLGSFTLDPSVAGTTVNFKIILDGNQISAVVGGTTLGPYTHSGISAAGKTGFRQYCGTVGSATTGVAITNYSIDTLEASGSDATADGVTLTGTATLTPGTATGGSGAVDATAEGVTLTGTSTLTPGIATGGASGSFVSLPMYSSGILQASVALDWTWYPGVIGAAPTATLVHGSGATAGDGTLTAAGLSAGSGFLLAETADGAIYYEAGTVV